MKKSVYTTLLLVFSIIINHAQNNNSVTVFTEAGEPFYLVINGVKQNSKAETNVKASGLNGQQVKAKVIFEEKGIPDCDKTIPMMWAAEYLSNTEFVFSIRKNKKGQYKWEYVSHTSINEVVSNSDDNSNATKINQTIQSDYNNNSNFNSNQNSINMNSSTITNGNGAGNGNAGVGINIGFNGAGINMNLNVNDGNGNNNMNTSTTTTTSYTTSTTNNGLTQTNTGTNVQSNHGSANINMNLNGLNGQNSNFNTNINGNQNSSATNNIQNSNYNYSGQNNFNTNNSGCLNSMSVSEFNEAKNSINSKSFDDTRLKIAKQVADNNCLSVDQIKGIMSVFSFEENKLEFAKYSYDHCTEKKNYYKIADVFTFDSNVQELNEYIDSKK